MKQLNQHLSVNLHLIESTLITSFAPSVNTETALIIIADDQWDFTGISTDIKEQITNIILKYCIPEDVSLNI